MKMKFILTGFTMAIFTGGLVKNADAQITGNLGTTSVDYGSPLAVQTINTGFGDSAGGGDATGSELDAVYGSISGGNLYLFIAGDFQDNGNSLNIFIADGRTGQSTLSTSVSPLSAMNGSVFSPGFSATMALDINDYEGTVYANTADLVGNTGGYQGSVALSSGIGSGTLNNGISLALNNTHTSTMGTSGAALSGATSGANTLTGLELSIPLSLLGNASGNIEVMTDMNGDGDDYISNQLLPGLAVGSGNLGTATFNFGSTPGQFVTVATPEPSSAALFAMGGLISFFVLRRRH